MTPTDAQIEAVAKVLYYRDGGPDWGNTTEGNKLAYRLDAKAALTAAAEVGEHSISADRISELQSLAKLIDVAIERCAQRAHDWLEHHGYEVEAIECSAAIRALKDVPA